MVKRNLLIFESVNTLTYLFSMLPKSLKLALCALYLILSMHCDELKAFTCRPLR